MSVDTAAITQEDTSNGKAMVLTTDSKHNARGRRLAQMLTCGWLLACVVAALVATRVEAQPPPPGVPFSITSFETEVVDSNGDELTRTNQGFLPRCPLDSAVGIVTVHGGNEIDNTAIFNLVPERGYPAEFGFSALGFVYTIYPEIRSDGDFGLRMVVNSAPTTRTPVLRSRSAATAWRTSARRSTRSGCACPRIRRRPRS